MENYVRDEFIATSADEGCSKASIGDWIQWKAKVGISTSQHNVKMFVFCSMRHIQRIRKRKGVSAREKESPLQVIQGYIEVRNDN